MNNQNQKYKIFLNHKFLKILLIIKDQKELNLLSMKKIRIVNLK